MRHYKIRLDHIKMSREIGIDRDMLDGNCYAIESLSKNPFYIHSNSIINFGFRIEEENNIQGHKATDGFIYAFVSVNHYENVNSIQEINLKHYKEGIEYWSKTKEERAYVHFVADAYYTRERPSKEFPYRVWFYGYDDVLFTKCYATLEDVEDVLTLIKSEKCVNTDEFFDALGFYSTN